MMGDTGPAGRIQQQQPPQPPPQPAALLSGSEDCNLGETDGSLTIANTTQQDPRRSDFEFEELLGLPEEDAKRWQEIILWVCCPHARRSYHVQSYFESVLCNSTQVG